MGSSGGSVLLDVVLALLQARHARATAKGASAAAPRRAPMSRRPTIGIIVLRRGDAGLARAVGIRLARVRHPRVMRGTLVVLALLVAASASAGSPPSGDGAEPPTAQAAPPAPQPGGAPGSALGGLVINGFFVGSYGYLSAVQI